MLDGLQARVTLRDVNDTPPTFSPSVYSQQYPENQRFDPSVVRVSFSDPDTTPSQLRLQLFGNGSSDFDIQNDGKLFDDHVSCRFALEPRNRSDSLLMSGLGVVVVVEGRGGILRIVTPVSLDACRGSVGEGRKVRNIGIHPA